MTAPFFIFYRAMNSKIIRLTRHLLFRYSAAGWRDVFGLPVVILLVLCFCSGLIFSGEVPFFRDLVTYFYPLRFVLYESYHAWKLPLWNRHMAMGFPFLADFQSGVFYGPHLFLALLPFFTAIRALFVFHFLIAAAGTYLLFRHWRYPTYLAMIAALLFTIGGTTVALTNLLNHFQSAVWLPWLILTWERLLFSISWKKLLVPVFIAANALLAGSPEIFVLCIALMLIDTLAVKKAIAQLSFGRILALLGAFSVLVAGLVMVQLLPTVELFLESRRTQPMPIQEALHWSLNPKSLLNLFFIDKVVDRSLAVGARLFFVREPPLLISYYLGVFSLFGLALWLCFSSLREKLVLLSLGSCFLIFALGSYTPVYPFLFRTVPMIGAIRFPEKFFFLPFVLLIYAALKGMKAFMHDDDRTPRKACMIMGLICVAWVATYLYFRLHTAWLAGALASAIGLPSSASEIEIVVASILTNLERQLMLSLGLCALLVLARLDAIRPMLVHILLVLAVFVDLTWAHKALLFPLNPDFIQQNTPVLEKREMKGTRLFYYPSDRNLHPGSVSVTGQPAFMEATALSVHNLLPNAGILYDFDYMQEIDALGRSPYAQFLKFANQLSLEGQLKLLSLCNVGYLVSFRERSSNGITLVGRFPEYYSWLYKINRAVPRAYVVNRIKNVSPSADVLPMLTESQFDPMAEAIVAGPAAVASSRLLRASAEIRTYDDAVVTVEVTSNDDGVLVLADSYYPGWRAYVDGTETPIYKTNHFFRGVFVRQGTHIVEFNYDPPSFRMGLLWSLAALFVILGISGFVYLRGRKSSEHPIEVERIAG